jgi:ribosomal protection tetracycline resistance protein
VLRKTLNLGILAHVDAGKTTLTERLLYAAGVIDEPGKVDKGTTQTDFLPLEQQRGITIRSAVVAFPIGDLTVNLIDTPGHPDFIAEVERVLSVLDGAVLVVSAVEGVQPQTRILMRALTRLRIPTLLYVNKIDRAGTGEERVLRDISERLDRATVAMGTVRDAGTRDADLDPFGPDDIDFRARLVEMLAERDDRVLAAYVEDERKITAAWLRDALASQVERGLVHPVFFGSALTGAGVGTLTAGIRELLPSSRGAADGPLAATIFKIERDAAGGKLAYVRVFSGTIHVRDRLRFGPELEEKVTGLAVFEHGGAVDAHAVFAGSVAKLRGLNRVQVGQGIGSLVPDAAEHRFGPPTLESVVAVRDPDERARLRVALGQLAEQDPLIAVRHDDLAHELSVSLYGEVQKEVIQATLADEYGLDATFSDVTPICIERPLGTGEAVEVLHAETNPFLATIGLRVDPAPEGSGAEFRLHVDPRAAPLYLYKTLESFTEHMAGYVRRTLREGRFGWEVTDCLVTMIECTYSVPDGPPSRRGPLSTAADFRKLTPLVLVQALERAGTAVCEPVLRIELEIPTWSLGAVLGLLGRLGAAARSPMPQHELTTIETTLPVARLQDLRRQLPALTGGEGVLESEFAGYRSVTGTPPSRRRTTPSPLNREEYLMHLARRV